MRCLFLTQLPGDSQAIALHSPSGERRKAVHFRKPQPPRSEAPSHQFPIHSSEETSGPTTLSIGSRPLSDPHEGKCHTEKQTRTHKYYLRAHSICQPESFLTWASWAKRGGRATGQPNPTRSELRQCSTESLCHLQWLGSAWQLVRLQDSGCCSGAIHLTAPRGQS